MQFYWDLRICEVSEVITFRGVEYPFVTDGKNKWVCRVWAPIPGTKVIACVDYWSVKYITKLPVFRDNPIAKIIGTYVGDLSLGTRLVPAGFTYVYRPLPKDTIKTYHRLPIMNVKCDHGEIIIDASYDDFEGLRLVSEARASEA